LAEWTPWSSCSKSCNGGPKAVAGIQTSSRAVIEPAKGVGVCADEHSPDRFNQMVCNDRECSSNAICNSKLDIVLLFDSSGSTGNKGFTNEKKFGRELLDRINIDEDHAKVGIVKYSKKITIEQPMSFDKQLLEGTVDSMTWDASTTETAAAMSTALSVLTAGAREDADNIVFVITDGMPNDKKGTYYMADEVKKVAKLVFVEVGKNLDKEAIEEWASFPPEQNILKAKNFKKLGSYLSDYLATICPSLLCPQGELKTNHDDKCLDYNYGNGNVYMHSCHGGSNQNWYLNGKGQLKTRYNDLCLDYHYGNNNVYMHRCHGGKNQQWYIDSQGALKGKSDDKCMDYNYNSGNVYMHGCHHEPNQQWKLPEDAECK